MNEKEEKEKGVTYIGKVILVGKVISIAGQKHKWRHTSTYRSKE